MSDLDDAIGMLYSVMAQVQGMDFILAPIVQKLETYKQKQQVVNNGSVIDGASERVS